MAATNLYHLLSFIPATQAWEMPPGLERAAQALVRSGRLRINAEHYRNFVRHGTADSDATFTARELTDPALLGRTRAALARHVPPALGPQGVEELLERLRRELVKARGVEPEKEAMVARVLVQSTDAAVMQLLLETGTEIFVSYAHNVGDLMAVHEWNTHGLASGLQATETVRQRVYISAGGDPFFEGEHKTYTTDGWPALARMVVIGAQEMGHFADLMRHGAAIVGRHSLSPMAGDSRLRDLAHLASWRQQAAQAGLAQALKADHSLAFFRQRATWGPRRAAAWLHAVLATARLRARLRPHPLPQRFTTHPPQRYGTALAMFLDDMAFNLAPQADVYRRADPAAEAAIATIEAVARVPQQMMKWTPAAVRAAWPHLAPIYEDAVLGGCRAAVRAPIPSDFISFYQKLTIWLRHRIRARPGYYPEPATKPQKS